MNARRRYVPDEQFPPYAFVPGRTPHPVSDPRGHSYRRTEAGPNAQTAREPLASRRYLYGIDLFNHGYYWEAHEVWEELWNEQGRRGPRADFLKGLIKLAAAGVKARQEMREGVVRHAVRARELFQSTAEAPAVAAFSLRLERLIDAAARIASDPPLDADPCPGGKPVLGFFVVPDIRTGGDRSHHTRRDEKASRGA